MRLLELREEKNLTQADVAYAIKTSRTNIGRWEKGLNEPTANYLVLLADFFEVSIDYLMGRTDEFKLRSNSEQKISAESISAEEKALLQTYRALNAKNRMHVAAYAQVRLEEQR